MHVAVFWKVVADLWNFSGLLKHAFNAEVLILRDVEVLDVIAFDTARLLETETGTYYLRLPITRSLRK